jgi:ABC-type transport system substrate-binding protein
VDVVRHDAYFRPGRPYLDGVRIATSMNPMAQRFRFLQGEIDFLRDKTGPDEARFQNDPRWKALGDDEGDRQVTGEAMNVEMPPFDNVEIRRAVAAAIDRDHYRLIRPGNLAPANQPIPPAVPGHDPTIAGQRYDYAAALEHMRRAGYPYDPATGIGGYPRVVQYVVYDDGMPRFTAQILQQELAKIGIRVEIKLVSYAAFVALSHRRRQLAFAFGSWSQDYPDASDFLDVLFSTSSINEDESENQSFYSNARLDDLLKRAREELDAPTRARLYRQASELVCDEAPWAFTHYFHYWTVKQPYLRGYRPHPVEVMYMAGTWLDRAGARTAERRSPLVRDALGSIFGARAARTR